MKKSILFAAALISLASCTKERDYLCTVVQIVPEGIVYRTETVHTFRGTYAQMKRHEAAGTFTQPWDQTTTCR